MRQRNLKIRQALYNVLGRENGRRALICYVVDPFAHGATDEMFRSHRNMDRVVQLAQELDKRGYVVDVTHWENDQPPKKAYDLVIGHGPAFDISCRRNDAARRIFLGTTQYLPVLVSAEERRLSALKARRGVDLPRECFARYRTDPGPALADSLLVLGNDVTLSSYAPYLNKPHWSYEKDYDASINVAEAKDYSLARKAFLWMASYAAVSRGLDLLIEVFSQRPNLHLWVFGNVSNSFRKAYQAELSLPNIHLMGWVDICSQSYRDAVSHCGFIIYPSASEGVPGSVVNNMAAGLVPIISKESGLSVVGFGVELKSCSLDEIGQVVDSCAMMSPAELECRSCRTLEWTRERPAAYFLETLRSALDFVPKH